MLECFEEWSVGGKGVGHKKQMAGHFACARLMIMPDFHLDDEQ